MESDSEGPDQDGFLGSRAEARAADQGTREVGGGFPKEQALGMGLLPSPLFKALFSSSFPPAPHFL